MTFLYNYILRLGFLDGREGLLLHAYHATYVSWKYAKAWELSRKKAAHSHENDRGDAASARPPTVVIWLRSDLVVDFSRNTRSSKCTSYDRPQIAHTTRYSIFSLSLNGRCAVPRFTMISLPHSGQSRKHTGAHGTMIICRPAIPVGDVRHRSAIWRTSVRRVFEKARH